MLTTRLPEYVPELVDELAVMPGTVARMHAKRGNVAGRVGQTAAAVMKEAHALMCERCEWVCNEKRLIESAGLDNVQDLFAKSRSSGRAFSAGLISSRLD